MEVVSRTDTLGDNSVGESISLRQGTHSHREPNDNYNTAQADRLVKEIYPGYMVIREDAIDTYQDTSPPDSGWKDKSGGAHPHSLSLDMRDRCDITFKGIYPGCMVIRKNVMDTCQDINPPDSGWKDKSGDAHPHSPNSDMKDRCNITQDIKKHDMEDVRAIYKDIHSPDSGSKVRYNAHHETTECEEYRHGREIKLLSSPSMIRLDHTQEPTLVKGGDKMITRNILTSRDDDLRVVEDNSGYGCKTHVWKEQVQTVHGEFIIRSLTEESDVTPLDRAYKPPQKLI